ncbi:MAG: conjugative transfer ATPase, partial [Gammaproteobacteria bacterium]
MLFTRVKERLTLQNKKEPAITQDMIVNQYKQHPSFAKLLPFVEWSDEARAFLLEDGISTGCLLELRDIATEAAPMEVIQTLHQKLAATLSRVVPLEDDNPWVLQFFVQDDASLQSLERKLEDYIPIKHRQRKLTGRYLKLMSAHFAALTQSQGLFDDPLTGIAFRGKTRRIRLALYRRYTQHKKPPEQDTLSELTQVCDALIANLQAFGMKVRRLQGRHAYEWLVRWFNPNPAMTGGNVDKLLQQFPYCLDDKKPHAWSFTQHIFFNEPVTFSQGWIFDEMEHKLMLFRPLSQLPDIGIISRERSVGDNKYALFDKLPQGCIYTLQITFESKRTLEKHLDKIAASAVGKGDEPKQVKANVNRAFVEMNNNNMLFRVVQGLYYQAKDDSTLEKRERSIMALLANVGLAVIHPKDEVNAIDNYLRFLPFNFNPAFDKKYLYRSAYQYATDVAALLPIYGRSRGDGQHPLNIFYNRGGEGFLFDHLHPQFKMANSHMAIIGSTGAGKSVFLNAMIMSLLAVKQARVFVIEAGGSFDLLARFIEKHEVSVNRLKFNRLEPIAVNPFAESYKALELIYQEEIAFAELLDKNIAQVAAHDKVIAAHANKLHAEYNNRAQASERDKSCEENRDILSEMALSVRVMVTGGLDKEEERFTLADDMLIVETLVNTIKQCKAQ